jgi:hypothetical protein
MLVNCNPSVVTPVEHDCLTFHQDRIAVIGGDFRPDVMRQDRYCTEQLDALV